jgi:AAA ATPase domain/AAA domain, putative AbiEii toxin, Type IV TA system
MKEHERQIEGWPSMRIKNLRIENFRGFGRFEMKSLGRINLIVGANNSGKTTVLEAISILMASGDASVIWSILYQRGETVWIERDEATNVGSSQFEIHRLFHDHHIDNDVYFRILADTDRGEMAMTARIERFSPSTKHDPQGSVPARDEFAGEALPPLLLKLGWSPGPTRETVFPIDRRGGVSAATIRRTARVGERDGFSLRFLPAASPNMGTLTELFGKIANMRESDLVTDWLRVIDPAIERISTTSSIAATPTTQYSARGGILVRLKGIKDWLPIGTLGIGGLRMFALAVNIVHSSKGILLVDGIDVGIHHAIMEDIWKILDSAAKRHDVQVFATTHCRDCYEGLASICRNCDSDNSDVTIQRVERGREEGVGYSERAIIAAAKHAKEVH